MQLTQKHPGRRDFVAYCRQEATLKRAGGADTVWNQNSTKTNHEWKEHHKHGKGRGAVPIPVTLGGGGGELQ